MAAVITSEKAGSINTTVLLFSGGMDSLCYAHLLSKVEKVSLVLLYIPSHTAYAQQETHCIDSLRSRGLLPDNVFMVRCPDMLNLQRFERDDAIVPNRNAHLILLASNFGDHIQLASVDGDRSTDKDEDFFQQMRRLLNHMWQSQHWCEGRLFSVGADFKNLTKTALVNKYLSAGGSEEALLLSYSCYRGKAQHCGICKPCARKWVALANNNVNIPCEDEGSYFEKPFWQQDWFAATWPQMRLRCYRGDEDTDFISFITKHAPYLITP